MYDDDDRPSRGLHRSRSDRGVNHSSSETPAIHYRGIRSLKHKHDKSYQEGLKKSNSLHDLSGPGDDGSSESWTSARERVRSKSGDRSSSAHHPYSAFRRRTVSPYQALYSRKGLLSSDDVSNPSVATNTQAGFSSPLSDSQARSSSETVCHSALSGSDTIGCHLNFTGKRLGCNNNNITVTEQEQCQKLASFAEAFVTSPCSNLNSTTNSNHTTSHTKLSSMPNHSKPPGYTGAKQMANSSGEKSSPGAGHISRRDQHHPPRKKVIPEDLVGVQLQNKVAVTVSLWEDRTKCAENEGLTLFGYKPLLAADEKVRVKSRPCSAPATSTHQHSKVCILRDTGTSTGRHSKLQTQLSASCQDLQNGKNKGKAWPQHPLIGPSISPACCSSCLNSTTNFCGRPSSFSSRSTRPGFSPPATSISKSHLSPYYLASNSSTPTMDDLTDNCVDFIASSNSRLNLCSALDDDCTTNSNNQCEKFDDESAEVIESSCVNSSLNIAVDKNKNRDKLSSNASKGALPKLNISNNSEPFQRSNNVKVTNGIAVFPIKNNKTVSKSSYKTALDRNTKINVPLKSCNSSKSTKFAHVPPWLGQDPHPIALPKQQQQQSSSRSISPPPAPSVSRPSAGLLRQTFGEQKTTALIQTLDDAVDDVEDDVGDEADSEDMENSNTGLDREIAESHQIPELYRSRSPTSSLLLNGRSKNETDERKVSIERVTVSDKNKIKQLGKRQVKIGFCSIVKMKSVIFHACHLYGETYLSFHTQVSSKQETSL